MCIERYRTRENFLATFDPSKQYAYTRDLRRVYMGEAPTLGTLTRAFGESATVTWLELQLIDLSESSGCKDKLTNFQLDSIAHVVMANFGYMKVTELMHFFMQFKGGKYGKFYGAVDTLTITVALREFAKERFDIVAKMQREEESERQAVERSCHDANVDAFYAALAVHNLTIQEWLAHDFHADLTNDELADIGWLLRVPL